MVIAHNLAAMNAQRQFNIVGTAKGKSTEKLSSGYRINRAADDAAGLSISEKMRKQVRGLTRASDNSQDGVSLCQVADGALNETHEILQRINELSIQSANGTNSSSDRAAIQAEVKQLTDEIDRIAVTTSFNERIYPLKGNEVHSARIKTSPSGQRWKLPDNLVEKTITSSNDRDDDFASAKAQKYNGKDVIYDNPMTVRGVGISDWSEHYGEYCYESIIINGGSADIYGVHGPERETYALFLDDLKVDDDGSIYYDDIDIKGRKTYIYIGNYVEPLKELYPDDKFLVGIQKQSMEPVLVGVSEYYNFRAEKIDPLVKQNINIHAGSESDMTVKILINIVDATKEGLGLTEPELDLSTEDGATAAIDRVKNAIEVVSGYRSYFGAVQNRMEHTIANLDNIVENTQAAESRIRDTDMAKEVVNNTKFNILGQAVTSMMTQANQSTQGVLAILQ